MYCVVDLTVHFPKSPHLSWVGLGVNADLLRHLHAVRLLNQPANSGIFDSTLLNNGIIRSKILNNGFFGSALINRGFILYLTVALYSRLY